MQTKREKTPQQALAQLMRLSSRAEKSSGDARRLMRGWGIPTAEAEKILAELIDLKFIDDERFAMAYTREKIRCSGWGSHKIRAALAAKGIARETIESTLQSIDPETMSNRLEKYLQRKRSKIVPGTPYEIRSKLMHYGLSLGYDYETVSHAIDKMV